MLKLSITAIGANPRTIITTYGPKQTNYLKAKEYNDKFLNFFISPTTNNWKVGDVIEVLEIEERKYVSKKDGSDQIAYNIKLPKTGNAELETKIRALEESLERTQNYIRETLVPSMKELNTRLVALEPVKPSKINGTELEYPGDEWKEGRDTNPDAF